MIAALLLACAPLLSFASATSMAPGSFDLRMREVDGDVLCSVQAKNVSVQAVIEEIAQRTARTLTGFEGRGTLEAISVHIEERPLQYAVATSLGATGLRARITSTSIDVYPDLGTRATPEELDDQTEVAYLRALKAFPDDTAASRAEFALAEIQERRGNDAAALSHFEAVARRTADAEFIPDALMRAGVILERMGDWREAARPFSALANLAEPHPHQARARLEIARCMTYTGDARQALFMLDALEQVFPAADAHERQARLYVRARALNGTEQHADALRTLAEAESLGSDATQNASAMEMRAEALEHFARPAEAARAWLSFSEAARGADRRRALANAARLALDADDWIAVLMIEKYARGSGAEGDIAEFARSARANLGLDGNGGLPTSPEESLMRAEELLSARAFRSAVQTCEALYRTRELLDEALFTRLASVYARALDADRGVGEAIDVLRAAVRSMKDVENRKRMYVLAAELYESHELFDEAIAAYGGNL